MAEESPQPDQVADADAQAQADAVLGATEEAIESVQQSADAVVAAAGEQPVDLPNFGGSDADSNGEPSTMRLLNDVSLNVQIELGRTRMLVEDVLKLNADAVIELDKAAGDPVDIYVNGRHVARGEVLVLNENFCVRVSEIIKTGNADD